MTLCVLIHRQCEGEQDRGTMRAWVVQEGHRSDRNLLQGRKIRDLDKAQRAVRAALWAEYRKFGDIEILWSMDGV
jgi:hypothetical protein